MALTKMDGEFCLTTHHFYFNDTYGNTHEIIENFSLPTTYPNYGCANYGYKNGVAMTNGVNSGGDVALPNEHGTWTLDEMGGATANVFHHLKNFFRLNSV